MARVKDDLAEEYQSEMLLICYKSRKEIHYNPSRFEQAVNNRGGVAATKKFISPGIAPGLLRLCGPMRLDLSMEFIMLQPKYSPLFTDEELKIAADNLALLSNHLTVAQATQLYNALRANAKLRAK